MSAKRVGRFFVTREQIDDGLGPLIYRELVPLRVEHAFWTGLFDVTAMGPPFDELEQGVLPPLYKIEEVVETWRDEGDWERRRVTAIRFIRCE